jgi:hypothetical protein
MSNTSTDRTQESFYGEVISTYTRAQAIEDGVLVDAGSIALEAGFTGPVALTSAVWADCVALGFTVSCSLCRSSQHRFR